MQTTNYKQNIRGVRTQVVEEDFSKGMYCTSTPLSEGYCHTLINMDIAEDGRSLSHRSGLRDTGLHTVKYSDVKWIGLENGYSKDNGFLTNYTRFFAKGIIKDTKSNTMDVELYSTGWNADNNKTYFSIGMFHRSEDLSIDGAKIIGGARSFFSNISKTDLPSEIHNMPLGNKDTQLINLPPTYCKAWDNEMYLFQKNPLNQDNLVRLSGNFEENTTPLSDFVGSKVIEPKTLNSEEVLATGYNSLSPTMYNIPPIKNFKVVPHLIDWSSKEFRLGVVDANLQPVEPMCLKSNTLYYIVFNYVSFDPYVVGPYGNDYHTGRELSIKYSLIETSQNFDVSSDKNKELLQACLDRPDIYPINQHLFNRDNPSAKEYKYDSMRQFIGHNTSVPNLGYHYEIYHRNTATYPWKYWGDYPKLLYFPIKFNNDQINQIYTFHIGVSVEYSYNYNDTNYQTEKVQEYILGDINLPAQVLSDEAYANTSLKTSLINYTLTSGKCLEFWKNRLWIGNVKEDPTMLFWSQTDLPEYFPYPSCTHKFPETIIKLITLKDALIVFTETQVYRLSYSTTAELIVELIQQNLRIHPGEAHLIIPVRNMIYFKSGNYYYMIVPKANSLTNELTIAPVSTNITQFLDNFQDNIYKIHNICYNEIGEGNTLQINRYYNFLDYDDIYNVFSVEEKSGSTGIKEFYIVLLYNTLKRHWRIYTFQKPNWSDGSSNHFLYPKQHDATKHADYAQILPKLNNGSEIALSEKKWDLKNKADSHANYNKDDYPVCYIDTGFREHSSTIKKRYREIQFNIHTDIQNETLFEACHTNVLSFDTKFCVDSEARQEQVYYTPTIDNTQIVLHPTSDTSIKLKHPTMPWALELMPFNHKVRMPVSGKGFAPRFIIKASTANAVDFTISKINYVYRTLNSR